MGHWHLIFDIIIPCARTDYEYWTRVGGAVFVRSRPPLTLPGTLSCAGGSIGISIDRKSAERTVLIANFRLILYFRRILRK